MARLIVQPAPQSGVALRLPPQNLTVIWTIHGTRVGGEGERKHHFSKHKLVEHYFPAIAV
jgi:hypothetical protein